MQKTRIISYFVATIVIIAGLLYWSYYETSKPSKYDGFAQCIADSGAKFYGAFWCSHCQTQKKMFESAARLLPYIECSAPDAKSLLPVCQEKNIESFPTWDFADGSRQTGEMQLSALAEKTKCELPQ
jgi:hypothetical protein